MDDIIIDSMGNEISVDEYLNTVSPQKTDAKTYLESFEKLLVKQRLPDSTSDQGPKPLERFSTEKPDSSPDISSSSELTIQPPPNGVNCSVFKEFAKSILCPIKGCSAKFKHKRNIKRHVDSKHGTLIEGGNYALIRYVCNICNVSNVYESNYMLHFNKNHNDFDSSESEKNMIIQKQIVPPLKYK